MTPPKDINRVGQLRRGRPPKKVSTPKKLKNRGRPLKVNAAQKEPGKVDREVNDRLLLFWIEEDQQRDEADRKPIRSARSLVIAHTDEMWKRNRYPERADLTMTEKQLKDLEKMVRAEGVEATYSRIRRLKNQSSARNNK